MRFNEENKVIIDTMNDSEARAFVTFLEQEITRHWYAIELAKLRIEGANYQKKPALSEFYKSAILRHQMDIDNAVNLCYNIINRFHLDDMLDGDN